MKPGKGGGGLVGCFNRFLNYIYYYKKHTPEAFKNNLFHYASLELRSWDLGVGELRTTFLLEHVINMFHLYKLTCAMHSNIIYSATFMHTAHPLIQCIKHSSCIHSLCSHLFIHSMCCVTHPHSHDENVSYVFIFRCQLCFAKKLTKNEICVG